MKIEKPGTRDLHTGLASTGFILLLLVIAASVVVHAIAVFLARMP